GLPRSSLQHLFYRFAQGSSIRLAPAPEHVSVGTHQVHGAGTRIVALRERAVVERDRDFAERNAPVAPQGLARCEVQRGERGLHTVRNEALGRLAWKRTLGKRRPGRRSVAEILQIFAV